MASKLVEVELSKMPDRYESMTELVSFLIYLKAHDIFKDVNKLSIKVMKG